MLASAMQRDPVVNGHRRGDSAVSTTAAEGRDQRCPLCCREAFALGAASARLAHLKVPAVPFAIVLLPSPRVLAPFLVTCV